MARTEAYGAGVAGMSPWRARTRATSVERVHNFGVAVVAFLVVDGMLPDSLLDGLFQLAGLEQRRSIWNAGDRLVCLKDHLGQANVQLLARLQVQAQPAEHDGDQPAGAGADDEVKVVAWLRDFVAAGGAAFDLDERAVHEFLDNDEHGVAANASSVCASAGTDGQQLWQELQGITRGNLPSERMRRGGPLVVSDLRTPYESIKSGLRFFFFGA